MRWTATLCVLWAMVAFTGPLGAVESNNALTGYSIASWTDGDGRPLGAVYAVTQDVDGYLWIGTDAGLVRFDGWRFAWWDTLSHAPLPNSPVSSLCAARDGSLWVGLADGSGVRHLRHGIVESVPTGGSGSVTRLVEDRDGTMWSVIGVGLYRLRNNEWERLPVRADGQEAPVLGVSPSRTGTLWVSTRVGLFKRIEGSDAIQKARDGWAWDATEDANGTVWVTDNSAGFKRANAPEEPPRPFEGNGYRLVNDNRGNLWIATIGAGLWRTSPEKDGRHSAVDKASLYSGLLSDSVQSVMQDREGAIWVGTTGGLHRLTARKVTPMVNVGLVTTVETAGDGVIWVGQFNGLMRLTPRGRKWLLDRPTGQISPYVRALHRDRQGTLWVGSEQGLFHVIDRHLESVALPFDDRLPLITTITSDRRGRLWISDGNGLFRRDGDRFSSITNVGRDRIVLVYGDSSGRLWIVFAGGKLGALDDGGAFRRFDAAGGLDGVHRTIYDVYEDQDKVIWVVGTGGLSRLTDGRFVTVARDSGLPASRIGAIADDDNGYLWLNLTAGLVQLKRDEVAKAISNPAYRIQYKLYDAADGVAGAPLANVRAKRSSDGTLWFVRGGGLTHVNPRELGHESTVMRGPVRIEGAIADDGPFNPMSGSTLPSGTRRVQINYTALTLRSLDKVRFRYRLDGFDSDWVDGGTRRQAFYTNLAPRRYRFRLEARADDETWERSAATWDFSIEPMFYQTRWFYLLSLSALGAVVGGVWRLRMRFVRHEFAAVLSERARLSREIHDTLLQNMIGLALQFGAQADGNGSLPFDVRRKFVRAQKQLEGYIREARQSIWNLRSPTLQGIDLASALRDLGTRATQNTGVRFELTNGGAPRQYSAKIEAAFLRIAQEAITNALRHGHPDRIDLELRSDNEQLMLRVHDNGCGFDAGRLTGGMDDHYGLTSMRERAEDIGGTFTVSSAKGLGTDIKTVVTFPEGA